jgi:capsular polysaccharide export protein
VSSGLGLEAIFAGHRPVVHGTPFYAGWGLTDDRRPIAKRSRRLTRAQLFAGAMILYPKWYDPYRDQLCEFEDVIRALEAQTRAWREDRHGWTASAMSRWKHPHLRAFFGTHGQVAFDDFPDSSRRHMVWASKAPEKTNAVRVEDGFLRSRGLGARLTPPLSLIADDIGIYYDPRNESRLERLIAESVDLQPEEIERSGDLISRIRMLGLSKYNISAAPTPDLPSGRRRLVVGQVEDDASVLFGAGSISANAALLKRANSETAEIVVVYKPHPDVEAGLRTGGFFPPNGVLVANNTDPHALLEAVDEVWTMTSLMGFEALLRGIPVTVTGAPFYAGWGLTRDLGEIPARRTARPSLEGLVHATLIGYPRYRDPVTGQPCPVEVIVDRLATGDIPGPDPGNRILSAFQTLWATLRPR